LGDTFEWDKNHQPSGKKEDDKDIFTLSNGKKKLKKRRHKKSKL
jgi:hypothetical protein